MRAYLPHYDLRAPGSLSEALSWMAVDPGLCPIAGGTDVMVLFAAGTLPPGRFVDIWGLDELRGIEVTDDAVTLGGLTTYTDVHTHPVLRDEFPMLVEAALLSGAVAIQNRGTLGGNIVNASPAADSPPALLAYDAQVELVSSSGARWVPYDGFHTGYKQMAIAPGELLSKIRIARAPGGPGAVHYYRKVGTRKAQAITKIGFAAVARKTDDAVDHLRIGLASVGPTVVRPRKTEQVVTAGPLSDARIDQAVAALRAELVPIDDVRSTARYRCDVACNLLRDLLSSL